jgi:hypothetical protein
VGRDFGRIRVNTVHPGVVDMPIWMKIAASTGGIEPIDPKKSPCAGPDKHKISGTRAFPRL